MYFRYEAPDLPCLADRFVVLPRRRIAQAMPAALKSRTYLKTRVTRHVKRFVEGHRVYVRVVVSILERIAICSSTSSRSGEATSVY
jgi:hypothetical protein